MAVVVEPVLTEEKIRSLLAEGNEQRMLDYKQTYDINDKLQLLKLVKCIASLQSEPLGGYIVIGANDHGGVVPAVTPGHAKLFDDATLRSKVGKYIAEPFELQTFECLIDGHIVILIYVPPNPHGWAIFRADGQFEDSSGKPHLMFRVGEVFVRHGSKSERWEIADQIRLIDQMVARRKEAWLAESRTLLAHNQLMSDSVQSLRQLPTSAITWRMDSEGFEELVTEFARRNDNIPVRHLLGRAEGVAIDAFDHNEDELGRLLDRVESIGAIGLYYGKPEWFAQAIEVLSSIYGFGLSYEGRMRGGRKPELLWLEIISRVYGLGALAVRLKNWPDVRDLAICRPDGEWVDRFGSWLRHGFVMASRAGIFDEEKAGLIARAHNVVRRVSSLHADRAVESDAILTSLCQFDVYGALAVISERGEVHGGNYYPSFAFYESRRAELAFVNIVTDLGIRNEIFPATDTLLSQAIIQILQTAQNEAFRIGGWDGIVDERVRVFLAKYGS